MIEKNITFFHILKKWYYNWNSCMQHIGTLSPYALALLLWMPHIYRCMNFRTHRSHRCSHYANASQPLHAIVSKSQPNFHEYRKLFFIMKMHGKQNYCLTLYSFAIIIIQNEPNMIVNSGTISQTNDSIWNSWPVCWQEKITTPLDDSERYWIFNFHTLNFSNVSNCVKCNYLRYRVPTLTYNFFFNIAHYFSHEIANARL